MMNERDRALRALQNGSGAVGPYKTDYVGTKFFEGNFWWATSEHIRKLPPLIPPLTDKRNNAEGWIGMAEDNYFSLATPPTFDLYDFDDLYIPKGPLYGMTGVGGREPIRLEDIGKECHTDKYSHGYLPHYSKILKNKNINRILEIGVGTGESLRMWSKYFPSAKIVGWDIVDHSKENFGSNVSTYVVNQSDRNSIKLWIDIQDNIKFDLIVDDGAHTMHDQQMCLGYLWCNALNLGGVYIVEDLHTSLRHNPYEWVGGQCREDYSNSSLECLRRIEKDRIVASEYMLDTECKAIQSDCKYCTIIDTKSDERHITSILVRGA
jgi:SAM-dependent methyltransferase